MIDWTADESQVMKSSAVVMDAAVGPAATQKQAFEPKDIAFMKAALRQADVAGVIFVSS